MSWVTNLLLHISSRSTNEKIAQVNDFFDRDNKLGLVSLDAPGLPKGWYGGDKMLEANLYVGAFNYLNLDEFLEHIRGLAWEEGDQVQAFVKKQEQDVFHVIDVFNAAVSTSEHGAALPNMT